MRAVRLEILAASTCVVCWPCSSRMADSQKAQHFSMPVALATGGLAGYRVSSAIDTNADGMLCRVASTATASMPPVRGVLSKPLGAQVPRHKRCGRQPRVLPLLSGWIRIFAPSSGVRAGLTMCRVRHASLIEIKSSDP